MLRGLCRSAGNRVCEPTPVSKRQSLCPDEDDANDKARAEASLREVRAYQFVKLQTPRNSQPSDSLIDK